MMFGTPDVQFSWSIDKPEIMSLEAPDPKYIGNEEFARLAAKHNGKCQVTVRVVVHSAGYPPSEFTQPQPFSINSIAPPVISISAAVAGCAQQDHHKP